MNIIRKEKDGLREQYIAKRREMDKAEKAERDMRICRAAANLASFRYARYVLLYAANSDEIDVTGIADAAWSAGKTVAYPRCDKETHTMKYHIVTSVAELSPESYGINEPPSDAPVYDPSVESGSAVCFVPGLLYDHEGYRLGYGKGFYDRYLSSFSGCKIGVVYDDFIVKRVPRGRYDVSLDILLTERGVRALRR